MKKAILTWLKDTLFEFIEYLDCSADLILSYLTHSLLIVLVFASGIYIGNSGIVYNSFETQVFINSLFYVLILISTLDYFIYNQLLDFLVKLVSYIPPFIEDVFGDNPDDN